MEKENRKLFQEWVIRNLPIICNKGHFYEAIKSACEKYNCYYDYNIVDKIFDDTKYIGDFAYNYLRQLKLVQYRDRDYSHSRFDKSFDVYATLKLILDTKKETGKIPSIVGSKEEIDFYANIIELLDKHNSKHCRAEINVGDKYRIKELKMILSKTDGTEKETVLKNYIGTITAKNYFENLGKYKYDLCIKDITSLLVDEDYILSLEKIR